MQKNSIQFFGLPGAGKTTISRALVKNFPDSFLGMPVFSKPKRFIFFVFFIIRFPRISFLFLALILKNNIKLWRYLFNLVAISFASHIYVLHKNTKKLFLIDEGLFQRLLSVAPQIFSEDKAKKVIKIVNKVQSKIIVVNGGDFGRFVTESDRMISPRNHLGENYFKLWSENLSKNFTLFSKIFKEKNISIEIDNSNRTNIDELSKELREKIISQQK